MDFSWFQTRKFGFYRAALDPVLLAAAGVSLFTPVIVVLQMALPYDYALVIAATAAFTVIGAASRIARRNLAQVEFPLSSLRALENTKDAKVLRSKLEFFFSDLRVYLRCGLGKQDYELFVLSELRDFVDLPESERPSSLSVAFEVIIRDTIDRTLTKGSIKRGTEGLISSLRKAFAERSPDHNLRMALRDLYVGAPQSYREFAVSPPRHPIVRFIENNPTTGGLGILALLLLAANAALKIALGV